MHSITYECFEIKARSASMRSSPDVGFVGREAEVSAACAPPELVSAGFSSGGPILDGPLTSSDLYVSTAGVNEAEPSCLTVDLALRGASRLLDRRPR
jgi:hypothetical protein